MLHGAAIARTLLRFGAGMCPAVLRCLVSRMSATDTYSHVIPAMQEEAAALIAALVSRLGNP